MPTEHPIDAAGHLRLRLKDGRVVVTSDSGQLVPRTLAALRERITVSPAGAVMLGGVRLARIEGARLAGVTQLCPFEVRYLAENGWPHPGATSGNEPGLATDLHAHLAGCPRPQTLIDLALAHDIAYPAALLEEAGIRGDQSTQATRVADLAPKLRARLQSQLALPMDRQSTFQDMERVYRLRSPVTKSLRAFGDLLDAVAADYAAMGARYVELSAGNVVERAWLQEACAAAARAFARHGLTLRFLTAIHRANDREWDLDLLDRVEQLGPCGPLVGVDFMGQETNSTRAFVDRIERIAAWADRARPGFVIRVHGGENPAFPENVRVAAQATAGHDVTLRIGHGLFGADDHVLGALRAQGAVVEFNLTSNLTLNNIRSSSEVPLRKALAAGVDCVLGSDGYGLYTTTLAHELRAARLTGATDADVAALRAAETRYIERRERHDPREPFPIPPDAAGHVHFTPAFQERQRAERAARLDALHRAVAASGAEWVTRADLQGRPVVSIAGAWAGAWPALTAAEQQTVRDLLDDLLPRLAAQRAVVITGGTRHGVEGEVNRRAAAAGLTVLATVVAATPLDAFAAPGPTHALLVGDQPHAKAAQLYGLIRDHDGLCLFVGGGNVVHDEIQVARNMRLRHLALATVPGAGAAYAERFPERAFRTADDVLRRLHDRAFFAAAHAPFWHLGPNATVDLVALRTLAGRREVLLIRRHVDAAAEPGRWALPGGFVATDAPPGEPFRLGAERPRDAVLREVHEETGLDLSALAPRLIGVGVIAGGGRDPRDTPSAWSSTHLFRLDLDEPHARLPIAGGDDAQDARWFALDALPARLAFDHAELIARALAA